MVASEGGRLKKCSKGGAFFLGIAPRIVQYWAMTFICKEVRAALLVVPMLFFVEPSDATGMIIGAPETVAVGRGHIRSLPLTKFYDTAEPFPPGQPGELIRSVEFDDYDLPMNISAIRVLYHSRGGNGEDVPASAVVLFPEKKAPAGGWPLIAWAHDLNGVARSCAPSLARNLRHGSFLSMYVQLGYAIVATDYAGLGTHVRNAFSDATSNANDVIYSIPAARKAVPQLGSRWIAMGTGEGGAAVLRVAELEHDIADRDYLGAIAISPIAESRDRFASLDSLSYLRPLFFAYGVETIFPQFHAKDVLTAKGIATYSRIAETCDESSTKEGTSASEMLKAKWEENPFISKYLARNQLGLEMTERPVLVLDSEADSNTVRTEQIVSNMCKQGDQVQLEKDSGYDPGRVIGDSVRDQIAWIEAVFAGKAVRNECKSAH